MLLNLSVANFIIFKSIHLDFSEGFNVFTGETGAGKSMIIDSLHLLLGGKSNKSYVRRQSDKATIQGTFWIDQQSPLILLLKDQGIPLDEDDQVIIIREIYDNGRSTARINGTLVNISFLKQISRYLLDIHGQYEQQSILDSEEHRVILDKLCGPLIEPIQRAYTIEYQHYVKLQQDLMGMKKNQGDKDTRLDYIMFQLEELNQANLQKGEEDVLFEEFQLLSNLNDIKKHLSEVIGRISQDSHSIINQWSECLRAIKKVSQYDSELKSIESAVNLMIDSTQDLSFDVINYVSDKELDESRLSFLNERLDTINRLKRKYKMEVDDLLIYQDKIEEEVSYLKDLDIQIEALSQKINTHYLRLKTLANELNDLRLNKSKDIEKDVMFHLHALNMKEADFKVQINQLDHFNAYGNNEVHFLISTNKGLPLMPLEQILSGGEVSRVMLAIKTIITDIDETPTMIFDEVDTGISGLTAHMVGEKIRTIANNHQVICVTHSPQIASFAHTHFKIEKISDQEETLSLVNRLNHSECIKEVARLLSGMKITETSLKNAEEMIVNNKVIKD